MPAPVIVVDYDPAWPSLYEAERRRIMGAAGGRILSIEHVGSTSVPGLGAKPIIDITAGVDSKHAADECVELLKPVGYTDVALEDSPEWFYCLGRGPHSVGYHVHLVLEGSPFHLKHIVFRDYLRSHPETAAEYYELKKRLSTQYRENRVAYTDSKSGFIDAVVERAGKA
ncbi:GrpB family protein [Candidatus Bathyarchaeota archaeon]|nr:GrpB family protein [Candidatus Bathyarchaeota archaeon]